MRALRLGVGVIALVFSFINKDSLLGLGGLMLTVIGLFNIGCGGTGACNVRSDISRLKSQQSEEVSYEEIKS